MSAEYFNLLSLLLRVLIFIAFALVFLYIVYCEGEKTVKSQKEESKKHGER